MELLFAELEFLSCNDSLIGLIGRQLLIQRNLPSEQLGQFDVPLQALGSSQFRDPVVVLSFDGPAKHRAIIFQARFDGSDHPLVSRYELGISGQHLVENTVGFPVLADVLNAICDLGLVVQHIDSRTELVQGVKEGLFG